MFTVEKSEIVEEDTKNYLKVICRDNYMKRK